MWLQPTGQLEAGITQAVPSGCYNSISVSHVRQNDLRKKKSTVAKG